MDDKFLKPYNPKETEDAIYALWEKSELFNPDISIKKGLTDKDAEVFSIVLPPPNVTGTLHLGHSMMIAIEDTLVRYNRMRGKKTLWIPGTDHAAIATESKVESILYKKEKKTRHALGKEAFLKLTKEFAQESHDTIVNQIKKLGASLDWSREAYTLDKDREKSVRTAFSRMYEDGLIYRGDRIVNWDPKLQTNVSDDEVDWKDQTTNFYYIKYGPFTIGTARPETKFGDKYVVMHPDDSRYKDYKHGQTLEVDWINETITATVIKDKAIDMEFGTGVMTITPWHDQTDFEIAERHNLDKEQVIDFRGILLPIAGEFAGEHINKAREKIVEKLKTKGLLEKIDEEYQNRIATNSRGGGIIEPQIMRQWFIDVNKKIKLPKSNIDGVKAGDEVSLKDLMLHVIESGQIEIIPERFDKTYFHWIGSLRDWNISRQIWFGHQIPVWYKDGKTFVGLEAPGEDGWEQDPDTLDTWFSSGLWTFSTLGWPNETEDMKTYHPTSVLETGYDIIFFWIARMILMSTYLLGEIPFKTVYLHGLVRDEQGKKMSKSLGNIIDPLDMTEKYGADAVRLALIVGVGPGSDSRLSENKIQAYKKFANKLWNISRFVLSNIDDKPNTEPDLTEEDKKSLKTLNSFVKEITDDIEGYRLYLAGEKLYHYVWHTFADKIIEESKDRLQSGNKKDGISAQWMLYTTLTTLLKLLHPFTPFVTEEIWQHLPEKERAILMSENWPT
jgi:valyl-tRNA synthetase